MNDRRSFRTRRRRLDPSKSPASSSRRCNAVPSPSGLQVFHLNLSSHADATCLARRFRASRRRSRASPCARRRRRGDSRSRRRRAPRHRRRHHHHRPKPRIESASSPRRAGTRGRVVAARRAVSSRSRAGRGRARVDRCRRRRARARARARRGREHDGERLGRVFERFLDRVARHGGGGGDARKRRVRANQ